MRKGILLLTIASFAALGLQAQANNNSNNNGASNSGSSSEKVSPRELASRHGLDMLDQTNKARTAIGNKNKEQALKDIEAATSDLHKVRSEVQTKVVPLYQEFATVTVIAPVKAEQKAKASGANSSASSNSTESAQNNGSNSSSVSTANVPESVHQVRGGYSVMELDTDGAMSHLNAAKTALNNGDWKTADQDLAAIQDGVVFASYQSDMPLVRAQENLILARTNARKGNYQEVHAALSSSAKALAAYAKEGGSHASDAKNLEKQITSFNQNVQQNRSDAAQKIDNWWNTASKWLQNPSSKNS